MNLRKTLTWLGLGFIALLFLGRIALPYVLKSQIEAQASKALGVPVLVDDVRLSLLGGEAAITGLTVAGVSLDGVPAPDDLFRLDELRVRVRLLPSLGGVITLDEVSLRAPRVRLRKLADGRLDATLLGAADEAPPPTTPVTPEPASEPMRVFVRHIELRDLDVALTDLSDKPMAPASFVLGGLDVSNLSLEGSAIDIANIELSDGRFELAGANPLAVTINVEAHDVTTVSERSFPLTIQTTIDQPVAHGPLPRLALQGDVTLDPVGFDGRIEAARLPIPKLAAAADVGPVATWLRSGHASGVIALGVTSTPEQGQNIRVGAKINVDDFRFANSDTDEEKEIDVAWKSLLFDLRETLVSIAANGSLVTPPDIRISEFSLDTPAIHFTHPSKALADLDQQQTPSEENAPEPAPSQPAAAPPRIRVDFAKISDGSFKVVDRSTSPSFNDRFENIELEVSRIDSATQTVGSLDLSLSANEATLAVNGSIGDKQEIVVDVDELDLAPFNAYALTHAGYVIEKGRLSLDSVIKQDGKHVAAQSKVTLHELDVKEAEAGGFEDQFGVSLSMGLALLRDVEGNIVVPVPIETSDEESAVRVSPIILNALRSALVGAITSPLKLLYAAVPGGEAQAVPPLIPFVAGTATLDEAGAEQVAEFSKLLSTRPALGLALRGQVGPLDQEADPRLAADGKLDALGNARVDALRSHLIVTFGIAPDRIRLDPQVPVGPPGVLVAVEVAER